MTQQKLLLIIISEDNTIAKHILLRLLIYSSVGKTREIIEKCDRGKLNKALVVLHFFLIFYVYRFSLLDNSPN